MNKWVRYFFTPGRSNEWDLMYLLLVAAIVEFLYKTLSGTTFDPSSFGTGFAALVGAGAGMQWLNNRSDMNENIHTDSNCHRDVGPS